MMKKLMTTFCLLGALITSAQTQPSVQEGGLIGLCAYYDNDSLGEKYLNPMGTELELHFQELNRLIQTSLDNAKKDGLISAFTASDLNITYDGILVGTDKIGYDMETDFPEIGEYAGGFSGGDYVYPRCIARIVYCVKPKWKMPSMFPEDNLTIGTPGVKNWLSGISANMKKEIESQGEYLLDVGFPIREVLSAQSPAEGLFERYCPEF